MINTFLHLEVPTEEVPIEKIPIEGPTKQVTPAAASNYPGTSTPMRPGDILYSSKSLFAHTLIVGHVAIVGPDYKVYHVSPAGEFAGKQDTLGTYRSRHGSKETIYVYRPKDADKGLSAADWASRNYSQVSTYKINAKPLYTLSPNYCSKFIWQAFYYSNGGDLTGLNRNGDSKVFITPGHVKNSNFFSYLTSFKGLD